jgi:sugar O-acyltransferase (sialic acid O-acetyltransferase NeuD family)
MEPVLIPLINPNEPEALLAALHVVERQRVAAGELLCTLETTKSTAELAADKDGFVLGLRFSTGQTVRSGEVLCYLGDDPSESPPSSEFSSAVAGEVQEVQLPPGLRITNPALELARLKGLDLSRLPVGPLVTESSLRSILDAAEVTYYAPPASAFDPQAVIIYGGGGHGKSLIDLLRTLGTYHLVGVIDDGVPAGQIILSVPVLGNGSLLASLHDQGVRLAVNAVGGIGDVTVRVKVFRSLAEAGFVCPALAHPSAVIEASATLSAGTQVFAQAYVGSDAQIGYGAIVNTGAIVSHDCILGDYANISPGAMLAGGVQVGSGVLVGMGATLNLGVKIGPGARIGNGATVKSDVPEKGVVRAGSIWPS